MAKYNHFCFMNEEEKGIVKEIVQLYKELCRLTNEGNHGAQEMLFKWENGDAEVVELWKTMNGWVYGYG